MRRTSKFRRTGWELIMSLTIPIRKSYWLISQSLSKNGSWMIWTLSRCLAIRCKKSNSRSLIGQRCLHQCLVLHHKLPEDKSKRLLKCKSNIVLILQHQSLIEKRIKKLNLLVQIDVTFIIFAWVRNVERMTKDNKKTSVYKDSLNTNNGSKVLTNGTINRLLNLRLKDSWKKNKVGDTMARSKSVSKFLTSKN